MSLWMVSISEPRKNTRFPCLKLDLGLGQLLDAIGETDIFILLEAVNCRREAVSGVRQRPENAIDAGLLCIERRQATLKNSELLLELQQLGIEALDLSASGVRRPDELRHFLRRRSRVS